MKDEILNKVYSTDETPIPRYQIVDRDGNVVLSGVEIRLLNLISQLGTPYNTESVLPNSVAYKICPEILDPSPADAFAGLLDAVKKAAPVNLLDNSDFRNPVNQRGKTSYTGAGYTIDRWAAETSTVTVKVNDGFITLSNTTSYGGLGQKLEHYNRLKGKMATIAVNIDGAIYVQHFKIGENAGGLRFGDTAITFYSVDGGHVLFRMSSNSNVNIYWVALYEGVYTTETLPEYHPKGYGVELTECQRYYYQLKSFDCYGYGGNYGDVAYTLTLPTDMRIDSPTVTYGECIAKCEAESISDQINRIDIEKHKSRIRFSFITLQANYKNKVMFARLSDICISADL